MTKERSESGEGNLLDLSIQAIRLRATVGEVSDALEKVFGRHRADTQKVTGVYAAAYDSAEGWDQLKKEIADFAEAQGRRPRVMISKLGQDGHDRGAKVVATAFADLGFDVDMGPLFQTPEECARQAIENDVHAVGVSTLAAGHKTLVPAIIQALKDQGADDIIVFVGGVIPRQDYDFLYDAGVKGIYGPGTPIPASAKDVLDAVEISIGGKNVSTTIEGRQRFPIQIRVQRGERDDIEKLSSILVAARSGMSASSATPMGGGMAARAPATPAAAAPIT